MPDVSVELPGDSGTRGVLNPFSVYRKSETMLRAQLAALSSWHLVNIIRAHGLSSIAVPTLEEIPKAELIELIVAAVRLRAAG